MVSDPEFPLRFGDQNTDVAFEQPGWGCWLPADSWNEYFNGDESDIPAKLINATVRMSVSSTLLG